MMIRATLDTNIFVSALNFGGIPNNILKQLEAASFTLCSSQPITEEIRRILLTRFGWSEDDLIETLDPILSLAEIVEPQTSITASPDPDDNRILECAVESKSDIIVTGDDDLLRLNPFQGIQIIKPRDFLDILLRMK